MNSRPWERPWPQLHLATGFGVRKAIAAKAAPTMDIAKGCMR